MVVGGVNIFGGSGTLFGALLGALLIGTLDQSLLRVPGISEFWRDAVLGLLILTRGASRLSSSASGSAGWPHARGADRQAAGVPPPAQGAAPDA